MKAEIIAVGSELLTPDRQDTNSLFLTAELNKIGIEIVRKTIVGDERALMMEAFRDALNRVPIIISSGGLGPTEDDLTRETVAELLGRRLVRNDDVVRSSTSRFCRDSRGEPPPAECFIASCASLASASLMWTRWPAPFTPAIRKCKQPFSLRPARCRFISACGAPTPTTL